MADKDLEEMQHKSNAMKEQLSNGQKMLSERNMACMKLLRQLDAVPGNSELNQYQRRFTELCFQGKHNFTIKRKCYSLSFQLASQ